MNKRQITDYDLDRLDNLSETVSVDQLRSEVFHELAVILISAEIVPQKSISPNVITMNTRVRLMELESRKEIEVTITYPNDANNNDRLVSILSRIGIALLGRRIGDIVSWPIPKGAGIFEVIEVTYQPEAVGNYYQ